MTFHGRKQAITGRKLILCSNIKEELKGQCVRYLRGNRLAILTITYSARQHSVGIASYMKVLAH